MDKIKYGPRPGFDSMAPTEDEDDEFESYDVGLTEKTNPPIKPDPRLISYYNGMLPSGVGGYRSWRHLIHKWETIKNDPPHQYQVCEVCGRRRIYPPTQHVGDMICYPDFGWLETGEWTEIGPPPRQGSATVGKSKFLQSAIEGAADKVTAHFMKEVDELLAKMRSEVLNSTAPRDQPMPDQIWACRWQEEYCTGPRDCGDSEIPRQERHCAAYVRMKE